MVITWIKNVGIDKHKENWSKLSSTLKIYKRVGKRNIFLFDWLLYMWENLSFSSVSPSYIAKLAILKTKIAILDTLWDDLADSSDKKFTVILNEIEKMLEQREFIEKANLTDVQINYLDAILEIYDDIMEAISNLPRYAEFQDIIKWDFRQLNNSMQFAHLINMYPEVDNIVENRVYGHHSMTVMICGMIDLMASPKFNTEELHSIRKILYVSQQMSRIGNMVNTYPREAVKNDISSEVATIALEKKLIKQNTEPEKKLKVLSGLLKEFDDLWLDYYNEIKKAGKYVKSVDMKQFLEERKFIQEMYEERIQYWNNNYEDVLFINY